MFTVNTRRQTFDLILEGTVGEPVDGQANGHDEDIVVDVTGEIREREATDGDAEGVGTRIGEVALDSSEIPLGEGEEPARLSRVEVEIEGELHPGIEAFVTQMRGVLGLKPVRVSKYGAGLFAMGQSPEADSDLGPTRIDDSLSLGELSFAVLRRQFATMRAHEAGSRLGEDLEEVHDMRVATRRMRAAIKLFQDALPERARWARDELKWVTGALGDVRDLDVQLEQIEEWSEGADEEGREALSRTGKALERQREEARGRLIEALDSARYERLESSFAAMLKLGPTREVIPGGGPDPRSKADEPVLSAGPDLLSHRYRKWCKLAEGIDEGSEPEDFHELRKEGKRLRYALEFFTPVYGEETTAGLIRALKTLQDDLGRHQDAIVATERLRELATGSHRFPTRAAFVMGLYAQSHLQEAAEVRKNLRETEAYRAVVGGKAWKGFEKEMKKARRSSPAEMEDVKPGKKKKKK
jgi:CHAD domain-containing protein